MFPHLLSDDDEFTGQTHSPLGHQTSAANLLKVGLLKLAKKNGQPAFQEAMGANGLLGSEEWLKSQWDVKMFASVVYLP